MSSGPWTIDSIAHALPHPELRQSFWRDVNLTPLPQLPDTITRWQSHAESLQKSFDDAHDLIAAAERGEEPPGEWNDRTDQILAEADRIRSRGAA